MKSRLLFIFFVYLVSTQAVFALTGREIMDKNSDLSGAKSSKTRVLMTIHKKGKVIEKEFKVISRKFGGNTKTLFTFIRPSHMKILTHSQKGRDDDQWLRLSSGKIKRITGGAKEESFAKSHITYYDLQTSNLDDSTYKNFGDTTVLGFKCYKVKALKKKGAKKKQNENIIYVRKSDFYIVRIDIYKKGKFIKYLENYDIKVIKGIITPMKVTVTMADNDKEKTILATKKVKYNIKIRESKFSKDALRN